jgi:hypothetical protein
MYTTFIQKNKETKKIRHFQKYVACARCVALRTWWCKSSQRENPTVGCLLVAPIPKEQHYSNHSGATVVLQWCYSGITVVSGENKLLDVHRCHLEKSKFFITIDRNTVQHKITALCGIVDNMTHYFVISLSRIRRLY